MRQIIIKKTINSYLGSDGIANSEELVQIVYMLLVSVLIALVDTALLYYPLYKYCIR